MDLKFYYVRQNSLELSTQDFMRTVEPAVYRFTFDLKSASHLLKFFHHIRVYLEEGER